MADLFTPLAIGDLKLTESHCHGAAHALARDA